MKINQAYNIPESIFILTLSNKLTSLKGTWSGYKKVYFIVACFLELSLQQKLVIGDKLEVTLVEDDITSVPYLDEIITALKKRNKPRKLGSWLRYFHYRFWKKNHIYDLLIQDMVEKKLLREKSSWWKKQYETSNDVELSIIEMVRAELLEEGSIRTDVRDLVFLLEVGNVLSDLFSPYEKEQILSRMKELKKLYPREWQQVKSIKRLIHEEAAIATFSAT